MTNHRECTHHGSSMLTPVASLDVPVQIPSGTQPETMLVMRGRGIRQLQGSRRGNQIVHIKIEIPRYVCCERFYLWVKVTKADMGRRGGLERWRV